MVDNASLDEVMAQLRQGDQQAATIIFHRFVKRLTALASHQFDTRFRAKHDAEDVVQSVYKSFFRRDDRDPFDLPDWDSLWSLLATITVRKCSDRRTHWRAACRNINREAARSPDAYDASGWDAIEQGPTPVQAAVLAEILELVLGEFPDRHRLIAEMCLQGYTAPEIAAQTDCSERTVGRVVARIKERLRAIDAGTGD